MNQIAKIRDFNIKKQIRIIYAQEYKKKMDPVIETETSNSSTSTNDEKCEMNYDKKIMDFLQNIATKCEKLGTIHDHKSSKYKIKYISFSISSIFFQIIVTTLTPIIHFSTLYFSILMMVSVLCTSINVFMNYNSKYINNDIYSNLYFELALRIQCELVRPKRHRQTASLFCEQIRLSYIHLNENAPS